MGRVFLYWVAGLVFRARKKTPETDPPSSHVPGKGGLLCAKNRPVYTLGGGSGPRGWPTGRDSHSVQSPRRGRGFDILETPPNVNASPIGPSHGRASADGFLHHMILSAGDTHAHTHTRARTHTHTRTHARTRRLLFPVLRVC